MTSSCFGRFETTTSTTSRHTLIFGNPFFACRVFSPFYPRKINEDSACESTSDSVPIFSIPIFGVSFRLKSGTPFWRSDQDDLWVLGPFIHIPQKHDGGLKKHRIAIAVMFGALMLANFLTLYITFIATEFRCHEGCFGIAWWVDRRCGLFTYGL